MLPSTGRTGVEATYDPDEEYDFYAHPENQAPEGPARRRRSRLSAAIPVRFPPELVEGIRRRASEDDRSISS